MASRWSSLSMVVLLALLPWSASAQDLRHARVDLIFAERNGHDTPGCVVSVMEHGAGSSLEGPLRSSRSALKVG